MEDKRRLTISATLSGLAVLGVWALDLQQVTTRGFLGAELSVALFAVLSVVFCLALLRRAVPQGAKLSLWLGRLSGGATLMLLGTLAVGFVWLTGDVWPLGLGMPLAENGTDARFLIATLAFGTLLHLCDAHVPRQTKSGTWISYVLMFAPIPLYFHEVFDLSHHSDFQGFAASALPFPCNLMIALWALVFLRSPAFAMLFDPRAPRSNLFVGASLVVWAAVLVLLEMFVPLQEVSLIVSYAMMAKLPLILHAFRPMEIEARSASGALDDAALQSPLTFAQATEQTGAAPEGMLEQSFAFLSFSASFCQGLCLQAALTFVMAFGATWLGTSSEGAEPAIWFANAYLAYCLLLQPDRLWPSIIAVFMVAVCGGIYSAEAVQGTPHASAALLYSGVHGLQGTLLAVLIRLAHRLEVKNRRITGGLFDMRHVLIGAGSWFVILGVTSAFGAMLMQVLQGGDLIPNLYVWASSVAMGATPMIAMIGGAIVKLHFGYKDLPPYLPTGPKWLVACTLGAFLFYANLPVTGAAALPHIGFVLMSMPLVLMPSLLQAGALLCVLAAFYSGFGFVRWSDAAAHVQYPFTIVMMSMLVSFTLLARYHFSRLREAEKRALTYAASALLTYDNQGRLLSISKNAQEWFDCSAEDMLGKHWSSFFDNYEELQETAVKELMDNPLTPFTAMAIRTRQSGQKLYLQAYAQANDDPSLPYAVVVSLRDVTAERTLQEEKAEIEEIVRAFMNGGPQYYVLETSDYRTVALSKAVADNILGLDVEEVIGRDAVDFSPEDPEVLSERRRWEDILLRRDGQLVQSYPFVNQLTGETKYLRTHIKRIDRANGDYYRSIVTEDVTDLTRALNSSEAFLRADTNAFMVQDEALRVVYFGERSLDLFGHDLKHLPEWIEVYPDFTEETWAEEVAQITNLPNGVIGSDDAPIRLLSATGEFKYVMRSYRWFPNPKGPGRLLWTSLQDVTDLVNVQNKLTELVDHDELTGLHSRRSFYRNFRNGARSGDVALYMLDIDHFKSVNDGFGHDAGDAFLLACGRAFEQLAEGGAAIRLGGEEFAIVAPWKGWQEARAFGEKVRRTIELIKIEEGGRHISRSVSVGLAHLGVSDNLSDCLHLADLALREAKETGRNKVCAVDAEMLELLRSRGAFITRDEVKAALHNREFRFNVQPIWNVAENKIAGFEALIRWHKPDGSMVLPSLFVDLLREVIREPRSLKVKNLMRADVLKQLAQFPDAYMSFNYTLDQLSYEGAARELIAQFDTIRDHPDRVIVLELSEQAMHDRNNTEVLHRELKLLHEGGFRIALDDFGIESSNLHRLQEFPIDIVKIDKVLIDKIEDSQVQRTTLRGLVHTMSELGIDVVAEGIETQYQARLLRGMGIEKQQGYLHARPMPPEDVSKRLDAIGADLPESEAPHLSDPHKVAGQVG